MATLDKRKKSRIDQILESACCPRQNEHIDIKRVAYNHVAAILQRCQKGQNVSFFFFFFFFFVTLFISTRFLRNYYSQAYPGCPGSKAVKRSLLLLLFSGTITDREIINTPLEPLRPVDVPFGGFVDIAHHFGGGIPRNPNFGGVNRRFQAKREKY